MQNRTSIHYTLQQRVYGGFPSSVLLRNARGSKYLVQRLQKEATLTGHEGCVNSIAWNESGEYLLSGADDCHLNIYRPTERKLVQSIRSGHRANIFSAKFLPCTGDKHIVSCAGDGTIHFTDLERESTFGQFQFDCHAGTTYEVVTTPGDPNTFLSCGEDGTVRLFDLRTKTKCLCRACKEDILIDCGKPVTSINLNPIMPYHLGVGCEDSTVRVFDRRTLSHGSSNKMKGMFCQFKPESLSNKNCRVTSLHYSPDGSELLVSYCADYVYLFTLHGTKQTRSSLQDDGSENGFSTGPNGHRNVPPLKRLRLRGDWSDTGPNARPESEHPSPESSLMQRMSDMFARWLEESFRAGQRYRTRTSSSRSASLSSTASSSSISSSPSYLSGSSSESSSTSGVIVEEPRRRRSHERSAERPRSGDRRGLRLGGEERKSNDATMDVDLESGLAAQENGARSPRAEDVGPLPSPLQDGNNVSNTCTTSVELIPHCEEEDKTSGLASSDAGCAACGKNAVDQQGHKADRKATRDKTPRNARESRTTRVSSASAASSSGVSLLAGGCEIHSQKDGIVSNLATSTHANTDIASGIDRSNTDHEPNRGRVVEQAKILSACSKNAEISTDVERCRSASLNSTVRGSCSGKTKVKMTVNSEAISSSHSEERPQREKKASRIARDDTHTNRTRAREDTHANRTRTERSRFMEPHASRTLGESAEESPSVSDRASAVTRIQRAYRLHKKAKSFVQDFVQHEGSDVWIPEMTRVYKGHRNSRTMIKEANFWGDGYVLSGSDCGRIFIWDKYSAELVMILQGDEHVVNCVQPHPFDPILASSGIDYDVKLWAPIAREPREPTDKEEIIRRNEKMLEESRDTITVPASFMIRMLASLNHARFGQRNPDEDTDTDSSDD